MLVNMKVSTINLLKKLKKKDNRVAIITMEVEITEIE